MPRDPSGIYTYPVGIEGVGDQPIISHDYNLFLADVQIDMNTPRPIVAGGTGGTSALTAMQNLKGEISSQVITNFDADTLYSGSFSAATTASGSPVADHAFAGIIYKTDADNIVIEARDMTETTVPGRKYVRRKTATGWDAWSLAVEVPLTTIATAFPFPIRGYISGMRMIWNTLTSISVDDGIATDAAGTVMMSLDGPMVKTTSAWSAGAGGGGMDTGTWTGVRTYHWFVIHNPTTMVTDVLFSISATAPTLPTGFTKFRRIGSAQTNLAPNWLKFYQDGDYFTLDTPMAFSMINPGTAEFIMSLLGAVPAGIRTEARLFVGVLATTTTDQAISWRVVEPGMTTLVPNVQTYATATAYASSLAGTLSIGAMNFVNTNTSSAVTARLQASAAGTALYFNVHGWRDNQGKD